MSQPLDVTTQVLEQATRLTLPTIELLVIEGADRGKKCRLEPGTTHIGTAAGNHLVLGDRTVSRLHCEVRLDDTAIRIVDLGSTNGTYLDGVRIYEAELRAGSTLRVGETLLQAA